LITSLRENEKKLKERVEKNRPKCKKCGHELGRFWDNENEKDVYRCLSDTCIKIRLAKEYKTILEDRKKHPEKFMPTYNIPKKYLSYSLDTFKGEPKLIELCKAYAENPIKSLFFSGVCGCGKTHLAVSILREMVASGKLMEQLFCRETARSGIRFNHQVTSGIFTSAPELLLEIRNTFGDSKDDVTEDEVINKYANMGFLILDDLGVEKSTEWAISTLYLIIDRRNREQRPTIFTSNLSLQQIEQHLSARIASRLADCKVIKIDRPDYRKKR